MTTASISEAKAKLSELLARVKAGESVTITDRGTPVAQIVPVAVADADWDARLRELARQGLVRLPMRKLDPEWLRAQPLVKARASVLEALLEERREDTR